MSTSNSLGRFTQSKEICIFLVNGDHICRNIVSDMLDHCRYEVFSYDTEMDALDIIREKKDILEIILTNVHRTYADKYGIIEHIKKEFKLQIILIPPDVDGVKKVGEGGGNGVTVYIVKSLTVNEVKNLLANAMTREKGKREISAGKIKRDASEENGKLEKKPRMVWSDEMHLKFVEAIDQLGQDKAFPKKIVELMNVQGLTRENVASHLQKHRMLMKKTQQAFTDFPDPFDFNTFGIRPRNPIPSLLGLNFFESGSRIIPNMPLLSTIQIKPERSFTICSDEKKNVLLSIEDNRVSSNSHFVGFRLASDGKSIKFGQNACFGIGTWNESYIQEEGFCPEMGNDDYTLRLEREYSASSIAGILGVDDRLTEQQPPPLPPGAATITPPWTTWADWAEPPGFSSQQPPSGDDANVNSEIFNELGTKIDENGVDASKICVFDDLLFDHQDLA